LIAFVLERRESAKCGVWPFLVVVLDPVLNHCPRVIERREPVRIEALVAKPSVEGPDERVVDGLSGTTEVQLDATLGGPLLERPVSTLELR